MPSLKIENEQRYAWDPFQLFRDNWPTLDSLSRRAHELQSVFAPDVEVRERNRDYVILIDVPGVRPRDIDITIEERCLTVSGKRSAARQAQHEHYITYERRYGTFSRTFGLPPEASTHHIRAELGSGVLTIIVPKHEALSSSRPSLKERVCSLLRR